MPTYSANQFNFPKQHGGSLIGSAVAGSISSVIGKSVGGHISAKATGRLITHLTNEGMRSKKFETDESIRHMKESKALWGDVSRYKNGEVEIHTRDSQNAGQPEPESSGASTPAEGTPAVPGPAPVPTRTPSQLAPHAATRQKSARSGTRRPVAGVKLQSPSHPEAQARLAAKNVSPTTKRGAPSAKYAKAVTADLGAQAKAIQ